MSLGLKLEEEQEFCVLLHRDEAVKIQLELASSLQAPVNMGEKVGEVICYIENEELCRYSVVAGEDVKKIDMSWCFSKILERYLNIE